MDLAGVVVETAEVIVGILVAFWLNNWNQRRLDGRKGRAYIESLRSDVSMDVANLERDIEYADVTCDAARTMLKIMRGETRPPDGNSARHLRAVQGERRILAGRRLHARATRLLGQLEGAVEGTARPSAA